MSTAQLHVGKRHAGRTADDVLADRSSAPKKAAILSALAAFDSDDDERDDTYDAADVGGTVDTTLDRDEDGDPVHEEKLFRAWTTKPATFARDTATRRSQDRQGLKAETGMTDEAIEGWAVMLGRDPRQRRRLEMQYGEAAWNGAQNELTSTAWRAGVDEQPGTDGADTDNSARGGGRGRGAGAGAGAGAGRGRGGRGRGGRGGPGGRGRGNVAGPSGERDTEAARRKKEAHKSSTANHDRRDQRAKKMARGGFPG